MIHAFGTFTFDDTTLELTREGRRVALEPQPARALARLLAGAGSLVTREELRDAIWGAHVHVDHDRGLAYCVGQVRTALGDSGDNPRFVQTLPKRGYRFVAPVSSPATAGSAGVSPPVPAPSPAPPVVAQGSRPTRWWALAAVALAAGGGWWVAARPSHTTTVAVSIFDNETGDPSLDGFVHGLSDVVVTSLTHLAPGRVGVIGNAAPLRQPRNIRNLKTLATTLDADYLVLGQLQRQDDRLRFIVHFIRLRDQVHLSAQRFVRDPGDVRQFEADVVAEAERAVQALASGSSGP